MAEPEQDVFRELNELCEHSRSSRPFVAKPEPEPDGPALHEFDFFAAEHAAAQAFEIALREVRGDMLREQRRATEAEREEVHDRWEIATACFENNEVERNETGWGADDLKPPPPWWEIEAELQARPGPCLEAVTTGPEVAQADESELLAEEDALLGGEPYRVFDYKMAGLFHVAGKMTVRGIAKRCKISKTRAYRLYRQFRKGAVLLDNAGLRPGPGYRWDPVELQSDPPGYKLVRA